MRRNPQVLLDSYLRQVEAATERLFGIGFSKFQSDLDAHDGPQLIAGASSGMAPAAFAESLGRHYPLLRRDDPDAPEGVGEVNVARMALHSFARDSLDWMAAADGSAYREQDGGLGRLVAQRPAPGAKVGYAASYAPDASIGADGSVPGAGAFRDLGGGPDIGDAIARLDAVPALTAAAGYGR